MNNDERADINNDSNDDKLYHESKYNELLDIINSDEEKVNGDKMISKKTSKNKPNVTKLHKISSGLQLFVTLNLNPSLSF